LLAAKVSAALEGSLRLRGVDPFEIGVLVVVAVAVLACCLAARANSGKHLSEFGARRHDRRRAVDVEAALELEDLQGMLDVTNARRRARGLPERSVADAMREFGAD
jgi:hypothetical protein